MSNKGIVFFDVDGTLIDCFKGITKPTEKTRESIKKLKENGYLTMLATGRSKSCLDEGLLSLGLDGYITSNGSYADIDDKIIFSYPINKEKLVEIVEYLNENNMDYILEGQELNYLSSSNNEKLNDLLKGANIGQDVLTDKWDINDIECNKIIAIINTEDDYNKTVEKYSEEFAFMKHPYGISFEIYKSEYTKGYGVTELADILQINMENTYAFGDGENDIEMFQAVKHGIAMGGYHELLEEHAYDFTEDVENEGISKGLKKLGLI
jgi:Cof subfamily protein (haloacid dehalogenase superfamily)